LLAAVKDSLSSPQGSRDVTEIIVRTAPTFVDERELAWRGKSDQAAGGSCRTAAGGVGK